jgi:hypothetical protein
MYVKGVAEENNVKKMYTGLIFLGLTLIRIFLAAS